MNQAGVRIQSDTGFHAATSTMAKQHDASVGKMKEPSRTSFESKRAELKKVSGVSSVDQDIQVNKENFKDGENDIQLNSKTVLKNQKDSLDASRKEISKDFKENDDEWITTKAGRAANPFINLNKTSKKTNLRGGDD